MFNEGLYWECVERGEYHEAVLKESHPAPLASGEPFCTASQLVAYYDVTGRKIAQVHQYLRPNGRLGGSGRPDPKTLLRDGVLYYV